MKKTSKCLSITFLFFSFQLFLAQPVIVTPAQMALLVSKEGMYSLVVVGEPNNLL